jgi:[acyl-carrier-protein] S-malonyltransferase
MSLAMVFPGQGSQSVGMLAELAAQHPVVGETFAQASAVLGYDLWNLVAQGPEEKLNATVHTQPAMLAAGVACFRVWQQQGGALPELVSGHSLGEFTALVCAGALEFGAATALVAARADYMQSAVPVGTGAMAALLGLDESAVAAACAEAAQGQVAEAVNYNAPGQVVIAGDAAAVARAVDAAKQRGARRAVMLPVSVPSHSSLMRGAADKLRERLRHVLIRAPAIRYLSAVDAAEHSEPADIAANLVRQLASPVRWTHTVLALTAAGVTTLIECGPGKVLTPLNKRIDRRPELTCLPLEDTATLQAALQQVKGAEA